MVPEAQREQLRSDLLGALTENPAPTVVAVCAAWRVFEPGLLPAESIKRRCDLMRRVSEKRQRKKRSSNPGGIECVEGGSAGFWMKR